MKNNRYTLYGYGVCGGLHTLPQEAEIVRRVYREYLEGCSYLTIASALTREQIPYCEGQWDWNKNRVKRMLEDHRYQGASGYPPIITPAEFAAVQAVIASRSARADESPGEKAVRQHICCAECGKKYRRFSAHKTIVWWKCRDKNCKTDFRFTPDGLFSAIAAATNTVIANPALLDVPEAENTGYHPNAETIRIRNEINRMLESCETAPAALVAAILKGIELRYDACAIDRTPERTEQLKQFYASASPSDKVQPELIEGRISAIRVAHNGILCLVFTNGAVVQSQIEREKGDAQC